MTWIRTYPDALAPELLADLLAVSTTPPDTTRAFAGARFDEWRIVDPELAGRIARVQNDLAAQYVRDCGLTRAQWPTRCGPEVSRLKRYRDGDGFPAHVDVVDRETARRFLAFLWYVKAPEAGGETVFLPDGPVLAPAAGACLVFPPLWPFLHEGRPAVGEKLILSSYLHYV